MGKKAKEFENVEPDKRKLTLKQANYLASISNSQTKELVDRPFAEAIDLTRWKIRPELWFHRRVCGRVVKTDPETGEKHGVPNATVHVEDTDCNYLVYSPTGFQYTWFFPWNCTREVIATTTTDECGNFCVWIPIFDIDRVVQYRRKRFCFPDIVHLDLCEILKRKGIPCPHFEIPEEIPFPRPPIPLPDPPPVFDPEIRSLIQEVAGQEVANQFELLAENRKFGEASLPFQALAKTPALKGKIPPPLPRELRGLKPEECHKRVASLASVSAQSFKEFKFENFVGPFYKCYDVLVPTWTTVIDVPDITFKVTQDVDGDGAEETIYSENFFEVRWDTTSIPDVELEADGSALASPFCGEPPIDVGKCTKPTILAAGFMPLDPPYHNASTGYALRPNRPRHEAPPDNAHGFDDSPIIINPGEAPYCGGVSIFACHRFGNAKFYRLVYAYEAASEVPFTGETWTASSISGPPVLFAADADGWYPIIPENQLVHPHWVFYWRTWKKSNGKYTLRLQIGDASKNITDQSDPVAFVVDNSHPLATFDQIQWRVTPGGAWQTLPAVCPVVHRTPGTELEFRVTYTASATHFRDVQLSASGCGGGGFSKVGDMTKPAERSRFEHWHVDSTDNIWSHTGHFLLPAWKAFGILWFSFKRAYKGIQSPRGRWRTE